MEQDPEVPLVTQSPGVGHLAEKVCGQDRHTAGTPRPGRSESHTRDPTEPLQQRAQIKRKNLSCD